MGWLCIPIFGGYDSRWRRVQPKSDLLAEIIRLIALAKGSARHNRLKKLTHVTPTVYMTNQAHLISTGLEFLSEVFFSPQIIT